MSSGLLVKTGKTVTSADLVRHLHKRRVDVTTPLPCDFECASPDALENGT